MLAMPITPPEITSIDDYRQERNGYQDCAAGQRPESTLSQAYFKGYCDRLIIEFDRDKAFENYAA